VSPPFGESKRNPDWLKCRADFSIHDLFFALMFAHCSHWEASMTNPVLAQGVRLGAYAAIVGLAVAGGLVALRAWAKPAQEIEACKLAVVDRGKVAEVLSGTAIKLADGRQVLLSGVFAPRPEANGQARPGAAESKMALSRLTLGKTVGLSSAGAPSKSGWLRAQLFLDGGAWVQGEMVASGNAVVRTLPDRRECAGALLRRETKARAQKKGLWATPEFTIHKADAAAQGQGRFGLVEGVVTTAANIRGRLFLNFGADYRTDFTVHVKPESAKLFADAGLNLESLEGRRVRVRGVIGDRNGPVINATAPEQLEILQ
jgi:micrococcal nuclease